MISFRTATPADFQLTYEIKQLSLKPFIEEIWGWDEEVQLNFHRKDFQPQEVKIVEDEKSEPVGLFCLTEDASCIYLKTLLICDFAQGKGIGTAILSAIIQNARSSGRRVELQVFKINQPAKKLYERLGFRTAGETDLHYQMVVT